VVAKGNDNQQIAEKLRISIFTVKKHLQHTFQTMGIHHRTELAALWHEA
jgi:DNA-binding NarL/FixJ family response regulator